MTRTIIIGGGVAGLATAALLAREGHQVCVGHRRAHDALDLREKRLETLPEGLRRGHA